MYKLFFVDCGMVTELLIFHEEYKFLVFLGNFSRWFPYSDYWVHFLNELLRSDNVANFYKVLWFILYLDWVFRDICSLLL